MTELTREQREAIERQAVRADEFGDYATGTTLRSILDAHPTEKAGADAMSDAARDVLAERERQVTAEGWTPEHDDQHSVGQMADAAACYALFVHAPDYPCKNPPLSWPWARKWWKPTTPRRDLVKAGALILAEIERLDRAARTGGKA